MAKKIKVKLILELRDANMSQREICRSRKMSQHSVSDVFKLATEKNLTFKDVKDKTDEEVYHIFYPNKYVSDTLYKQPDYNYIHSELKKTGVTLKLLWKEYKDACITSGELSFGYTKLCEGYSDHVTANSLTNHLVHKPGMVCEVDWSGPTMKIVDPSTGELITAYLFVATLPYSQYSYVEPCLDMKQNTWIKCNVNMFEFFGGSTVRITCDNLKTGVITHPREGDIILNEQYEAFGNHYYTAIMPAGIKKPKQKASVEGTVGKVATAIIAKLRNETFFNLSELKIAVSKKVDDFNNESFQKREGSRSSVFNDYEKLRLRELPLVPYEVSEWGYNHKVNLDCHVAFKTNRYSAPYNYVGKKVDIKASESLIEIYYNQQRIAIHKRIPDYKKYQWATNDEHMPDQFNHAEWDDTRIKNWANSIGPNTGDVVNRIFNSVHVKEQAYNSCLSVLRLSKKYTNERLEVACEVALEKLRSPRYRNLKAILSSNQDKVYLEKKETFKKTSMKLDKHQGYVRGAEYYRRGGDE
jgi:transposase